MADGEELYSLLVPLAEDRLIVPRACVAEVVRYVAPQPAPGAHRWYLGTVSWSGRSVPLASFEAALGKETPDAGARTRIVVFHASAGKLKSGYYGMLTQGFPQLVRVNRDVLKLDEAAVLPDDAPVLCKVRMINEFPLIPDLERLEHMIAEERVQA